MSTAETALPLAPQRTWLDRILSISGRVEAGEGIGALLLALNVFLLLGSYYILKTVREALILSEAGAVVKSYASAGQALLFLLVVPVYGAIASRVNRARLIGYVLLFFIANLAVFYLLGNAGARVGVAFYLWLGIFNMLTVAQFWAFANDVYTEEEGKRLFPVVGIGASVGALVGARFASAMFRQMGPYQLIVLSAAILLLCILLTVVVHRREAAHAAPDRAKKAEQPLDKKGGFQLLMTSRYLLLIAALVFLLNLVNTTGEILLSMLVEHNAVEAYGAGEAARAQRGAFIGEFYGDYYSWVNLLGFLIQTFLVSRLFAWIGVRGALFVLPVIALGGYSLIAFLPVLAIVKIAKIFENSTDYSLNNTVRHALYLPTSREAKYKAKAATDTFFVRAGDMFQAGIVYVGTALAFSISQFAMVVLVMVGLWLAVAGALFRAHKRLTGTAGS